MSYQRAEDRWLVIESEHAPTAVPRPRHRRTVTVPALRNPLAPIVTPPVLLPIIGANDELLPALEDRLHPIAVRARNGDRIARNALYAAFEPKIVRISRRLSIPRAFGTDVGIWDRDDVYQEAFIAFAELIDSWTVTIPFGRYVLAQIPWRLRDAVYRGVGKRSVPPRTQAVAVENADWLEDGSTDAEWTKLLLSVVGDELPPPQGRILYEHICDGKTLTQIARELGISRRTITRHWTQIRRDLAEDFQEVPRPDPPTAIRP
ncbi:MAG: sigma-70 family RNA polymerase sigma factor [Thermomicrobiales bacterium]